MPSPTMPLLDLNSWSDSLLEPQGFTGCSLSVLFLIFLKSVCFSIICNSIPLAQLGLRRFDLHSFEGGFHV